MHNSHDQIAIQFFFVSVIVWLMVVNNSMEIQMKFYHQWSINFNWISLFTRKLNIQRTMKDDERTVIFIFSETKIVSELSNAINEKANISLEFQKYFLCEISYFKRIPKQHKNSYFDTDLVRFSCALIYLHYLNIWVKFASVVVTLFDALAIHSMNPYVSNMNRNGRFVPN